MQDAVEQKTIIIRSQVLESIHKAIVLCYSTGTPQTHTHMHLRKAELSAKCLL